MPTRRVCSSTASGSTVRLNSGAGNSKRRSHSGRKRTNPVVNVRNEHSCTSKVRYYFVALSWLPCCTEGGCRCKSNKRAHFEHSPALVSFSKINTARWQNGARSCTQFRNCTTLTTLELLYNLLVIPGCLFTIIEGLVMVSRFPSFQGSIG